MADYQSPQLRDYTPRLTDPLFTLKTHWVNYAGLTVLLAIVLGIFWHKGKLDFAHWKAFTIVIPWLFLMLVMSRTRIILTADALEFRYLIRKPCRIEIGHLQSMTLDSSGKNRTLNFYDDAEFSKEPLEFRGDFFSMSDITRFEQTLRTLKPDLK